MVLKIIDLILGNWGRFIRDFYFDHSLLINAVVFLYAVLIVWIHNNLRSLYFNIERLILELVHPDETDFEWEKIKNGLLESWLEENSDRQYILPTINDFWFEKIPAAEIMKKFFVDENFIKMVIIQKRSYPANKALTKEEFTVWKDYLHQMKRGLRSKLKRTSA